MMRGQPPSKYFFLKLPMGRSLWQANCYPSIHPCTRSPDGLSRSATTSSIFSFHCILFTVRWTAAGSIHPQQSMMSSTHHLGGHPLVLSPSTMPSITVYQSIIVHSTYVSEQLSRQCKIPPIFPRVFVELLPMPHLPAPNPKPCVHILHMPYSHYCKCSLYEHIVLSISNTVSCQSTPVNTRFILYRQQFSLSSFFLHIPLTIPWQKANSLTFPGFPEKWRWASHWKKSGATVALRHYSLTLTPKPSSRPLALTLTLILLTLLTITLKPCPNSSLTLKLTVPCCEPPLCNCGQIYQMSYDHLAIMQNCDQLRHVCSVVKWKEGSGDTTVTTLLLWYWCTVAWSIEIVNFKTAAPWSLILALAGLL